MNLFLVLVLFSSVVIAREIDFMENRMFKKEIVNNLNTKSCDCSSMTSCSCCENVKIFYTSQEKQLCLNMIYQRNGLNFDLSLDSLIIKSITVANYKPFHMCSPIPGLIFTTICVYIQELNQYLRSITICPRLEVISKKEHWQINYSCSSISTMQESLEMTTKKPMTVVEFFQTSSRPSLNGVYIPTTKASIKFSFAESTTNPTTTSDVSLSMSQATIDNNNDATIQFVEQFPATGQIYNDDNVKVTTTLQPVKSEIPVLLQSIVPSTMSGISIVGLPTSNGQTILQIPKNNASLTDNVPDFFIIRPTSSLDQLFGETAGLTSPTRDTDLQTNQNHNSQNTRRISKNDTTKISESDPFGKLTSIVEQILNVPSIERLISPTASNVPQTNKISITTTIKIPNENSTMIEKKFNSTKATVKPTWLNEKTTSSDYITSSTITKENLKKTRNFTRIQNEIVIKQKLQLTKGTVFTPTLNSTSNKTNYVGSTKILKRKKRNNDVFDIYQRTNRCERAYKICVTKTKNLIVSRIQNVNGNNKCIYKSTAKIVFGSQDDRCDTSIVNDDTKSFYTTTIAPISSFLTTENSLGAIVVHDESFESSDYYPQSSQHASPIIVQRPDIFPSRTPPLIALQLNDHLIKNSQSASDTLVFRDNS